MLRRMVAIISRRMPSLTIHRVSGPSGCCRIHMVRRAIAAEAPALGCLRRQELLCHRGSTSVQTITSTRIDAQELLAASHMLLATITHTCNSHYRAMQA